jgi:ABC-type transporter Mla MlaB component
MAHRERSHQGLLVSNQESDVAAVLSVAGAIDMVTAPQLQTHVDAALARRPAALVIDLSLVEFLGTAGIAVLVHVRNNAADMPWRSSHTDPPPAARWSCLVSTRSSRSIPG